MYKSRNMKTGYRGEDIVEQNLENQGYVVSVPENNFEGDLKVYCPLENRTWRVEVKTSNRNRNGCFSFCINRDGKTSAQDSEILALVFIEKKKISIRFMDTLQVCGIKKLGMCHLPDDYGGKYKSCLKEDMVSVQIL